jgi:pimeloyl-ACP methyl ester carboxylesterase
MDDLSDAGFDVWALDFLGYGESDRYPAMDAGTVTDPPLGRVSEASAQIARAVVAVRDRTGIARLSLIAHSWGTLAAGHFATAHPERVDRLVLFGPVTLRQGGTPADSPAYHDITLAAQWQRFTADVPTGEPPVLLRRHFDLWGSAYLATDPTSGTRTPPSVRTPGGPAADGAAAKQGEFPYDPAAILAPTLIVRGEWDSVTTDTDARWLFDALTAAPVKRDVKIGRATHLMHLEEGRYQLYRAVQCFLEGGDRPSAPPPETAAQ